MSERTQRIARWAAAAGIALLSLASCSTARIEDGGIVGTGNRIDCESEARKDGKPESLPEECRRGNRK